jgi:transcription elongation factor GreA
MEEADKQYLTKEGLSKLKEEIAQLKMARDIKKKEEAVAPSSQTIDSEFATFQEDLNLLEARIQELETILKNYILIIPPKSKNIVELGATVVVEVEGQKDEFTIVGPIEASPQMGKISNESPVGKALLGSKKGEKVLVQSSVRTTYTIKKIIYRRL